MTLHARYQALHSILSPWSDLWGYSIFHRFEAMQSRVPESWFRYAQTVPWGQQYRIGQGSSDPAAPTDLCKWISDLRTLCEFPRATQPVEISPPWDRGLTPKKKHEIASVLGFFSSENTMNSHILDVGGGVGHLARHLALQTRSQVETVDRDAALQASGVAIHGDPPWVDRLQGFVQFSTGEFPGNREWSAPSGNAWAVGLHTCGPTAWAMLELVPKGFSLLSFGCCYEHLQVPSDTQRSRWASGLSLPWTDEALFLANRGGVERTPEEFEFQQRMQRYRFTLHALLLNEGISAAQAEAVGAARTERYQGPFRDYVRDRVPTLKLSDRAIEVWELRLAPEIEKKRWLAFLRNILARPLEVALILDRAIWLQEQGFDAEIREFFDPKISPRNLGIISYS